MKNFKCYSLSLDVYALSQKAVLPAHLKRQLDRAASSIALNLAEGWGRQTTADRRHLFTIAFGSIRECQAICDLGNKSTVELSKKLDHLAASLYKLIHAK